METNQNNLSGNLGTKKRKKFKVPTPYTIIFVLIFFVVILSWILDWSNANVVHDGQKYSVTGAGIIDIFRAPFTAFIQRANILVFILAIGAFSYIVMKSKALEALTESLVRKMGDKSIWIIPILVTALSFFGTSYGMCEESLGFLFIICPLMLAMGFDVVTAVLIIIMGVDIGTMMAITDPFLITTAVNAAVSGGAQVSFTDGIIFRVIAWVIMTIFTAIYIVIYALRVKKDPKKSVVFEDHDGHKEYFLKEKVETVYLTKKRLWICIIYLLAFLIMVVYLVSWDNIFGFTDTHLSNSDKLPNGASHWWQNSIVWRVITDGSGNIINNPSTFGPMLKAQIWMLNNFPYFAGFTPGLGNGDMDGVSAIFLIASIIVGLLTWRGEEGFVIDFIDGARDVLGVVFIIALASSINVIFQETGMSDLAKYGISLNNMNPFLFIIASYIIFIPLSFAIPSTSGFSMAIFPIWGKVASGVHVGSINMVSGSITAFSYASGWANLFSPATGLVMGSCSLAKMNYIQLLKALWPCLAITFIFNIVLLITGTALDITGIHFF